MYAKRESHPPPYDPPPPYHAALAMEQLSNYSHSQHVIVLFSILKLWIIKQDENGNNSSSVYSDIRRWLFIEGEG